MSARTRGVLTAMTSLAITIGSSGCRLAAESSGAMKSLDDLPEATASDVGSATPTTLSARQQSRREACEREGEEGATASLRPSGPPEVLDNSFMSRLRENGKVQVGVDENTPGFSARDPLTGTIDGFEVELAREIAKRIFGDDYTADRVVLVPLVTREKVPFVQNEEVDLTISAVSMSCRRWADVNFSTEYYTAHQELLVRSDSDVRSAGDLAGRTVCVTEASSSIGILEDLELPGLQLEQVGARTDCLVKLQQQQVDAYFGHDSFLFGMLPQDPTLERRAILDPAETVSHYGIAINEEHEDFVRFVNAVLEELRADGTWSRLHTTWLAEPLNIPAQLPPTPRYRAD